MARFLGRIFLALLLTLPQLPLHAADALPALLAELARSGELRAGASTVRNSALLQAFYRAQAQQPAWSDPLRLAHRPAAIVL